MRRASAVERNRATRRQRTDADSPPQTTGDRRAADAAKVEKEAAKYHCRSHIDADREWIMTHLRNGMKPREIEGLTRRSSAFIYRCKAAGRRITLAPTIADQLSGYCSLCRRSQTGVQEPRNTNHNMELYPSLRQPAPGWLFTARMRPWRLTFRDVFIQQPGVSGPVFFIQRVKRLPILGIHSRQHRLLFS